MTPPSVKICSIVRGCLGAFWALDGVLKMQQIATERFVQTKRIFFKRRLQEQKIVQNCRLESVHRGSFSCRERRECGCASFCLCLWKS